MWKALAGAVAAAILLAPIGGAQEGPRLVDRVSALEESVQVLEVGLVNEIEQRQDRDLRLARCGAKPARADRLACFDRLVEWFR